MQTVDVRRGGERFVTRTEWLESRHSFSFGEHYDAANTGFGVLMVNNHDLLSPTAGFPPHPHRGIDVVTWVLEGELVHEDDRGNAGHVRPGVVQVMSAGSGVRHSERNPSQERPVELVQMWVVAADDDPPSYDQADVADALRRGGLVPLVGGAQGLALRTDLAELHAALVPPNGRVLVPSSPLLHVYVARGGLALDGVRLDAGDAARITDADGGWLTGGAAGAELLVWRLQPPEDRAP